MSLLKSLSIENFRGIQKLRLEKLSRFTILAGRNNSGKTSVLEALFYMSGMGVPDMPERIGKFRLMKIEKNDDLRSVFYGGDFDSTLKIVAYFDNGTTREVTLSKVASDDNSFTEFNADQFGSSMINKSLLVNFRQCYQEFSFGKKIDSGVLETLCDNNGVLKALSKSTRKEILNCAYLPTRHYLITSNILEEVIRQKSKQYIIETLHNVDVTIKDIIINGEIIEVDVGLSSMLPLATLGDGLVRITAILATAFQCRNGGILLVDEIDNGLHYSAMEKLWRALISFSLKNSVQVIATTHSLDFLRAIASCGDTFSKEDFTYIKLSKRGVESRSFPFSQQEFESAIETDTEIR